MGNLDGRVALVTGGGRGLGKHMALHLAQAGANVAVVGRSLSHLEATVIAIEQNGGRAIAVAADITDRVAVEKMALEVKGQLGVVDILVNNAGVISPGGPVGDVDPDAWWHLMKVNVYGAFLCSHVVLPDMLQRNQGRIINVASGAALWPIPCGTAYCTSKAALVRFTDCLAEEVKANHVSVFVINPGTVRTDMSEFLLESDEGKKWAPWFADIFKEGRDVPPELSAELVVLLASGSADRLSGRFISVEDVVDEMVQRIEQIERDDLYTLRLRTPSSKSS